MVLTFVLACEVAFWVVLFGGLAVRYLLRLPRLGAALLLAVPLIDLALLVATAIDLRSGATASWEHGLAAVYLGVSVAYGHRMVRWVDIRFAHRFNNGPAPVLPPRHGGEHAANQRQNWLRHMLAWAVGCALLLTAIIFIGEPDRTQALWGWISRWSVVLAIDFLWSFSYTVWPRRAREPRTRSEPTTTGSWAAELESPQADPGSKPTVSRRRVAGRPAPTAAGTPR